MTPYSRVKLNQREVDALLQLVARIEAARHAPRAWYAQHVDRLLEFLRGLLGE